MEKTFLNILPKAEIMEEIYLNGKCNISIYQRHHELNLYIYDKGQNVCSI